MYVVILAGGGGTRLWPLSSSERPKPFLPLLGAESLLQRTVARLAPLVRPADVVVVTDRRYEALVRDQVPGVAVLAEPEGRNTAAAIALAVSAIERPDDEVMAVLPADHAIAHEDAFRAVLEAADRDLARGSFGIDGPLVTLGVHVDRPATEYGYLVPVDGPGAVLGGLSAHRLRAFEEKPTPERAAELFESPGIAWNAGMFLWQRRAIRDALARHTGLMTSIGGARTPSALVEAYAQTASISIDYAVMEPAAREGIVVMGAMDVGWSDLGGWPALMAALGGPAVGGVVRPGDTVVPGPDDLVLARRDGRLEVLAGPLDRLTSSTPMALFPGLASARRILDALVERVELVEARP